MNLQQFADLCSRTRTIETVHDVRGAFKKFCNSTIKKNGNVTNNTLFFNIITTEFNAFATFFWLTVNSIKIEIFCLSSSHSLTASLSASSTRPKQITDKFTIAQEAVRDCGFVQLDHTAYSPDLAPSDYFLFYNLKSHLRGVRYPNNEVLKEAVKEWLEGTN